MVYAHFIIKGNNDEYKILATWTNQDKKLLKQIEEEEAVPSPPEPPSE